MKKPERKAKAGAETSDNKLMLSLFWSGLRKTVGSLTHVWKTVCMHAQAWTLFCVANQQSGRNQVVTTTTTTKSYDQRLCYQVETFVSFNHSLLTFSLCI
jgi:hypothetical protein